MNYIEFNFTVAPKDPGSEILAAHLAEIGFESFVETDKGFLAYISSTKYSKVEVEKLSILKSKEFQITYNHKNLHDINWNEEWEKSYNAVTIAGKCCVRAPFHQIDKRCKYDIIIEPKMSFGTAHHETTALMIQQILNLELKKRSVLDIGCGTGVLAILAAKMKASLVTAIDMDEWAFNNSLENIKKNKVDFVKVLFGGVEMAEDIYDFIFANINRNILMNDIPHYAEKLKKSGILLMSGFYEADLMVINEKAEMNHLVLVDSIVKNKWMATTFKKK
jgi:ribosomal protein L11 methyltransferase